MALGSLVIETLATCTVGVSLVSPVGCRKRIGARVWLGCMWAAGQGGCARSKARQRQLSPTMQDIHDRTKRSSSVKGRVDKRWRIQHVENGEGNI